MAIEVLLIDHVEGLGIEGDVVKVSSGYARNFLFPKGYASEYTQGLKRQVERKRLERIEQLKNDKIIAAEISEKISKIDCIVEVKVGKNEKMFGSVGIPQLAEQLSNKGIEVDRKKFKLHEPIQELGTFEVPINLHPEVEAIFKVSIVKEK
tara:strand:+ start:89 stop:541 length:453 start_codon:yes stop_codon:yes gene_type:complete